ncbi:MAG: hypothetical protein IJ515_03070 [Clostridia bacterium]|nr:hypothetical protein [Clostridia bacterium]
MDTLDLREKRTAMLSDYLKENKTAAVGMIIHKICLYVILISRALLAVWEIAFFSISGTYVNILGILFIIPLIALLFAIDRGYKLWAYVVLAFPITRLILYFTLLNPTLPNSPLADVYPFTLFAVMILQFTAAIIILTSHACDVYYIGIRRINIKLKKDVKKAKNNT